VVVFLAVGGTGEPREPRTPGERHPTEDAPAAHADVVPDGVGQATFEPAGQCPGSPVVDRAHSGRTRREGGADAMSHPSVAHRIRVVHTID
jgi:hypothetical protein